MTIKTTWASGLVPVKTRKHAQKYKKGDAMQASLLEKQTKLRKFIAKNPGLKQSAVADGIGWERTKLERVLKTIRAEFYTQGLVLKSEVRIG